ncbi:PREDICTED: protein FAM214A-like [Priapulus caudatus]|uniref:Protein FAM214A-like n=1 Tax=Priapulus caudatus TaxID=37621 RepID=A0ABM1ELZ7_PRICU|nr:PREDICTED: protein FAM214A-like [Priapulus caudatus]
MKPEEGVTDMQLDLKQPEDWFTEFGMLVLEGRVPCNNAQGHSRGPHCPSMDGSPVEWVHDNCSTHDKLCKRAAQWKQQMMQMFHNDLPMMLEVLVYPNCTHGDDQVFATSATSGPPGAKGFLLEQWTIQILPKRDFGNPISTYMLMQAVRSYLHFSQLSAWWNLTHGTSPCKVGYRLCVPGEAVCSVFDGPADQHVFPSPSICKTSAMKISVTSLPRCSDIRSPDAWRWSARMAACGEGSDTAAAGNTGARRKTKAADRKEKESHGVPLKADVATSHRCPTFDAPEHRSSPPVDIPDRYIVLEKDAATLSSD